MKKYNDVFIGFCFGLLWFGMSLTKIVPEPSSQFLSFVLIIIPALIYSIIKFIFTNKLKTDGENLSTSKNFFQSAIRFYLGIVFSTIVAQLVITLLFLPSL